MVNNYWYSYPYLSFCNYHIQIFNLCKQLMKRNGFTLIELLVVVAIIGILAAVGVTAYSGYTTSAKKAASKSNHKTIHKYVMYEMKKCELNGGTAMDGKLDCDTMTTEGEVSSSLVDALAPSINNPYDANDNFTIRKMWDDNCTASNVVGRTHIEDNGDNVTIVTCFDNVSDPLKVTFPIE